MSGAGEEFLRVDVKLPFNPVIIATHYKVPHLVSIVFFCLCNYFPSNKELRDPAIPYLDINPN